MKFISKNDKKDHLCDPGTMYERSFRLTCQDCGWYVILRRNGGAVAMFINNFNYCPKCQGEDLDVTLPTLKEKMNPLEQIRKYYYKIAGYK